MKPDADSNNKLEQLAARIADDEPVNWKAFAGTTANLTINGLREMQQLVQRSGRFRFGALTVLEPIGEGAQGEVWRAYDPMLDLYVALKLRKLESDTLSHQFLDEARRLARVRQANIVSVYGAAVNDGRAGLWTELVRGTSLAELLAQHGPFPAEEARGIGLDLCHALAAVHRHGLLHGDVKTENVMREVSGRIVLMDFGAARELDEAQTSVVTGTLNYLAPEVLRGASPSPASDIYALGVLLFRLLSGAYPYTATDTASLVSAQDRGDRARLATLRSGLPKSLVAAVEQALHSDPAQRPASALAFAAALAPRPARSFGGWRGLAMAAALAGLVAAGVTVGISSWHVGTAPAWQTELAFQRVDAHGGHVTLNDGASIALGDRLALEFHSSRPVYVYIFDDDGSAEAAVLFPLDGIEPRNPLAADTAYRLPGKAGTTSVTWQVSRRAERETFVVVAADVPQAQLEQAMQAWQHASAGTSRGALGLAPAPDDASVGNAALRVILDDLDRNSDTGHVRRWHFNFPHADG
jgi:hypothetical protein